MVVPPRGDPGQGEGLERRDEGLKSYDIVILGAGPGGYVAAIRGAQRGAKVLVIEREEVGGTCLNWGCIPTKALIASAETLEKIQRASAFGIMTCGEARPDLAAMVARKDKIVEAQVKGIKGLFQGFGVTLIYGEGTLKGGNRVSVRRREGGEEEIEARKIIVATGSRPAELPGLALDGRTIISSTEALSLAQVPSSLLIVGAGVIGCEFAFLFRRLGTEVFVVEMLSRALPMEDEDISRLLEREMKRRGIALYCDSRVEDLRDLGDGTWAARITSGQEIRTEKIMVSVGRKFNAEGIGLETVGISLGSRGEIPVNERMETQAEGVYAIGDVVGGMLLAHVASRQGIVAVTNATGGEARWNPRIVPNAIFTTPEVASVGLKEREAKELGYAVKVARIPYRALGKSHTLGEIVGEVKMVAAADTGELLGVHIVGSGATEIIHEAALALSLEATVEDLAEMVHAHPTLSELLMEAAHGILDQAIHVPPRT
jgi:dihydrolipoamide dehydrogenase